MRDKLCYLFGNMALIAGNIVTLFFVLLGVDVVFDMMTFWGYIFTLVGSGYVTSCGIAMAMSLKAAFKTQQYRI